MRRAIEYDSITEIFHYGKIDLARFVLVLFYICSNLTRLGIGFVLPSEIASSARVYLIQDILMVLLILLICTSGDIPAQTVLRLVFFYSFIYGFIGFTYILHPEYKDSLLHPEYGLKAYFYHIPSAIFGYLILRLFRDKKKLITAIIYCCRLNILWYLYLYAGYLRRGFWPTYDAAGNVIKVQYNLNYGYQVVFCFILYILLYLFNKQIIDLILSVISIYLVLSCGSRGSLICIAVATVLVILFLLKTTAVNTLKFYGLIGLTIVTAVFAGPGLSMLFTYLAKVFDKYGISSRTLRMFIKGKMDNTSGRDVIYQVARDMIRQKPITGYGFFGDRYRLRKIVYFGYPHNVVLEIMIQFGVIIGTLFLAIVLYKAFRMLIKNNDAGWMLLLIVFLTSSVKPSLPHSFWYYYPF